MDKNTPKPGDVVIAVMGVTGVGKSTFVSHFTREHVPISNRLNSCTQKVGVYKCSLPDVPEFFLVDTPGFDDTDRSDAEVLKQLAKHLAFAFESNIMLTGLVYLHRIMDNRFGGASGRNLRTFKKLTGEDNLGSVVLGTTFWKKPISTEDVERETQLNSDKKLGWSTMLDQGAECMRQDQGSISGAAIVKYLIDRRRKVELRIQTEMVKEKKTVAETEAGAEVISEMRKIHEEAMNDLRNEMMEAMRDRDRKWQQQIEEEREARYRLMKRDEKMAQGLRERISDWWDDIDCVVM